MRKRKKWVLKSATCHVLIGSGVLFSLVEFFLLLVLNVIYLFFCENFWRGHVFKLIMRVLSIFPSPIFRIQSTNYLISPALSTDSWLVNLTFSRSSKTLQYFHNWEKFIIAFTMSYLEPFVSTNRICLKIPHNTTILPSKGLLLFSSSTTFIIIIL